MIEIGSTLVKLRNEKGLCQKELSAHLSLSAGTISNYENNVHLPDLNTLRKLADYFGVTTDYLLGRTEQRCSPKTMTQYLTGDYETSEIVNTILSLDANGRNSALSYLFYLKKASDTEHKGDIQKSKTIADPDKKSLA